MFVPFVVHLITLLLGLNTSANDVMVSFAAAVGSRSLHRRLIVLITLASFIFAYFSLSWASACEGSWQWFLAEMVKTRGPETMQVIYELAFLSSCFFNIVALAIRYPIPLDCTVLAFFCGHFLHSESFSTFFRLLSLSFFVMPVLSACITWSIYRILIKGVMFATKEDGGSSGDKFKNTLTWCGFIYPLSLALSVTGFLLKYILNLSNVFWNNLLAFLVFNIFFGAFYALFKVFLRAWLKRRVFLLYPQEYAVYMERSEKVEQGDREARGLGPIQDYYLPKSYAAAAAISSYSGVLTTSASTKQDASSIHIIQPTTTTTATTATTTTTATANASPAVIAGKLAITSKRSEELFRPVTNFLSIATFTLFFTFESGMLLSVALKTLARYQISTNFIFWSFLVVAFLPGSLFISKRVCIHFGREIISDLKFSQAFAIQFGVLLTSVLGLTLRSVVLAPSWYLLFSLAAVFSSDDKSIGNSTAAVEVTENSSESADSPDKRPPRSRNKIILMAAFWTCSIVFSACFGFTLAPY